MAVYYKFKSAKDFSTVPVDGPFLSVFQLKERIVEKMRLGRPPDFDLLVSNAQTNEEYADEGYLIPKNTSVLVRRVPGSFRIPIRPEPKVVEEPPINVVNANNTTTDWTDEFGVDLYEDTQAPAIQPAAPPAVPAADVAAKAEEEAKIKAFCDASASDWQRQTQQAYAGGRGGGRGGRGMGRGGIGFMRKTPPDGYVCHRCNEPGHYIQHCPTNKDPSFNIKRVKLPTGIPRTMLVSNPDGSYALPNGEIAVLRPNEEIFEKEVVSLKTSNRVVNDVPAELRCPLCKDVLKDAVLTSKCCFKSYCDRCIRNEIISKGRCVCGATNVLADDLLPNKTLRDAIERLLESNAATSSGDNNQVLAPDSESVLPAAKASSPVLSSSIPNVQPRTPENVAAEAKDPAEVAQKSPETVAPGDEAEVESSSAKEVPDSNSNEDPGQQAKKNNKAKRMRPPKQNLGGQMQWRPDGAIDGYGHFGAPFWPPHPIADGFMMPYGAAPYSGAYGVPFDVPFNGPPPLLPDPYGYPGMVPPYPQSDFSRDYPAYGNKFPRSSVMSREEFEAKKAEAWRKRRDQNEDDRDGKSRKYRDDQHRNDDYDYRDKDSDRDRRGSSRDRRIRPSSHHHHEGYSSGDDDRRHQQRHKLSSSDQHRDRDRDRERERERERDRDRDDGYYRSRAAGTSYRSSGSHEDSKRKREEEEAMENNAMASSSSSSRRVSVFLRVKQEEQERKRARESNSNHHHRVDTMDNEAVKSVFTRIAM